MSRIQDLALVRDSLAPTGLHLRVLPHDEVISVVTESDSSVSILLRRPNVRQTITQTYVMPGNLILTKFTRDGHGSWSRDELRIADDQAGKQIVQEWGKTLSVEEAREKEVWEAACSRPGNKTRLGQRDSFNRAHHGYTDDYEGRNIWANHKVWSSTPLNQGGK